MDQRYQQTAFIRAFGRGGYKVNDLATKLSLWAQAFAFDAVAPVAQVLDKVCARKRDAQTASEIRRIVKAALIAEIEAKL